MLVISRKPTEEFRFPHLGISVRVLNVQGRRVRIGIDAPDDVQVVRSEILKPEDFAAHEDRHDLKNRLHRVGLALHLVQRQIEMGRADAATQTLDDLLNELNQLEGRLAGGGALRGPSGSSTGQEVLIVEDDANERELLRGLLELDGYRVTTAADGLEALERLSENRPSLVLLDMRMPRYDGRQTIDAIRMTPAFRHLKIVAVSGTSPASVGIPIGEAGVDDWFPKPIDPRELLKRLKRFEDHALPA